MTTAKDLIGVWHGAEMFAPGTWHRDVLHFNKDGTGWFDFYNSADKFGETYHWSVERPAELRLKGNRAYHWDHPFEAPQERVSTLDLAVPFAVREEGTEAGGRVRVLRLAVGPWPGTSDHYRFGGAGAVCATFQAPGFLLDQEAADPLRGQALAEYLAGQLEGRRMPVGPMHDEVMPLCYFRPVQVDGQEVGLGVSWESDRQRWWLRVEPPKQGSGAEVEALCLVLGEILGSVRGLQGLEWHTNDDRAQRVLDRARSPNG